MTASLSTMSIDYYLETAAADGTGRDLTSYYISAKSPAGRWFGAGLDGLNLNAGGTVERDEALALFRDHADPLTGQRLGRPVMGKRAAPQGAKTPAGAAAKDERSGVNGFDVTFSPPKSVSTLWALAEPQVQGEVYAAHLQAVEEALRWAEQNVIQSRAGHGGVAHVPVTGIAASLFDHWDSRNGDPQLHTHAVIVNKVQRTSDGEWVTLDSYTLHRNLVAISEKYDSLLMDRLHQRVGAIAESRDPDSRRTVESLLASSESPDQVETSTPETSTSHRVELSGIPEALIDEFSTRARMINEMTDDHIAEYTSRYGRRPTNAQILQIRREATLASRQPKDTGEAETLPEKMRGWRRRALNAGYSADDVVRAAVGHPQNTITAEMITQPVVDSLGSWTLNDASMRRTTFSHANVLASAERVTRLVRCSSAQEREQIVSQVVDDALSKSVGLTPDRRHPRLEAPEHDDPAVLNRGESVFDHRRTGGVFTTRQIMDEEAYLIGRTEATAGAPAIEDQNQLEEQLSSWRSAKGYPLSEDKHAASVEVLTSHAGISAMIGPAGTGKTTTMSAITDIWQHRYGDGSVVGLAPSAVAAGVLADEISVPTENTAKWLYESVGAGAGDRAERAQRNQRRLADLVTKENQSGRPDPWRLRKISELRAQLAEDHAAQAKYQLRRGQLLIVDEASMVATPQLAELASQAERAGAKVLLVGDPAQLEAVEAGGFLGHMERNTEVSRLTQVFRFKNDWEKQASLGLREGQEAALTQYAENDRIHGDLNSDSVDDAYTRWKADRDRYAAANAETPESAKSTILIASDNETVEELNQRAHADMVNAGEVDIAHTVEVRAHHQAGVGETLLARKNNRSLRDSDGAFIANGTLLTVTGIRPDGSAEAVVDSSGASVTLDKDYLADSVELGYAVTAHRAQGVTVTSAHAVVSPGLSRELFYVAMTRGVESNDAYVQLDAAEEPAVASWRTSGDGLVSLHEQPPSDDPVAALTGVLARSQAEQSAHEVQDAEHGWANDLGRMVHERSYLMWAARTTRTQQWISEHYPEPAAQQVLTDGDWQRLVSADPALNHPSTPKGTETAAEIIANCQRPDTTSNGPGGMLTTLTPASPAQQQSLATVDEQIRDQLAIRAVEARREQPDWYQRLAQNYPDEHVPQKALDAALIWRAASNQTDSADPMGKKPPARDYLRPLWDRAQATLYGAPPENSVSLDNDAPPQPSQSHPAEDVETHVPREVVEAMAAAWEQMDVIGPEYDDQVGDDFNQWVATHDTSLKTRPSPAGPTI